MGQHGPAGHTFKDQDPVVDHKDHQESTGCKVVRQQTPWMALTTMTAPGGSTWHSVDTWLL